MMYGNDIGLGEAMAQSRVEDLAKNAQVIALDAGYKISQLNHRVRHLEEMVAHNAKVLDMIDHQLRSVMQDNGLVTFEDGK